MSLIDNLRNFLDGTTPEERARHEETHRRLKTSLEKGLAKTEKELREFDYMQKPENNVFPENIDRGPEVDAYRAGLVRKIEHYREELSYLS